MKRAIIGYTGFVGSNLLRFYKFDYFFNSKNINDIKNLEIDELYFAGLSATKWYINKNPEEDIKTVNILIDIIKTIKFKKIILISTIDIYNNINDNNINEDNIPDYINNHSYGKHRYIFEKFIMENFTDYNIIRLPAIFGLGLKKNIIYDLINNNQIENISPYTSFQWYDIEWLKDDIGIIIKNNIKICNLFTEPLDTIDIINIFNINHSLLKNKSEIKYNLGTKYSHFFGSDNNYIRNKNIILENIRIFINFMKIDKTNLCVSNICIKYISQFQFANILKLFGIKNIQIAPTTLINNWNDIDKLDLNIFKNIDLNIYSFQSITYGLNNLNIFTETKNNLINHIKAVIDCAYKNNIKIIVFGCPKNRYLPENIDDYENIFINFFRELGDYCNNKHIKICLEPNSKKYNCNYLNLIREVGEITKKINNDNIKMMIDIGNIIMENDNLEDIYIYKDIIYNIDISQENMKDFSVPHTLNLDFCNIIKNINYNKKINLEMLINNNENELNILNKSLYNFINLYGNHCV